MTSTGWIRMTLLGILNWTCGKFLTRTGHKRLTKRGRSAMTTVTWTRRFYDGHQRTRSTCVCLCLSLFSARSTPLPCWLRGNAGCGSTCLSLYAAASIAVLACSCMVRFDCGWVFIPPITHQMRAFPMKMLKWSYVAPMKKKRTRHANRRNSVADVSWSKGPSSYNYGSY